MTKERILAAALKLAAESHYASITREKVAASAGYTPAAVNYHYGTMDGLRDAVVQEAIRSGNLRVTAQAAVNGVPMPAALRRRALRQETLRAVGVRRN